VKSLGADMIKVQVNWATVAPRGRRKPSGFNGADPSQYPGWARYDSVLADAKARGFKVMFALAPPAPGWATPTRGDREGVTRPERTRVRPLRHRGGSVASPRRRLDDLERAEPPGSPLSPVHQGRPPRGAGPLPGPGPSGGQGD
jgi:hypothetical protein